MTFSVCLKDEAEKNVGKEEGEGAEEIEKEEEEGGVK